MDQDTIQQDVSEQQDTAPTKDTDAPRVNPRRANLEDIAARRATEVQGPEETTEQEQVAQEPQPVVKEARSTPVFEKDGVWMTRVKVNGVEQEVPLDKVTAKYQKDAAGDEKLRLAAEKERRLAEQAEQLKAYEARLMQQQAPSQPSQRDVGSPSVSEKELAEAIYAGDEELVAQKMRDFRETLKQELLSQIPKGETIDPRALAAQVEREMQQKLAVRSFHDEFQDVATDPYLFQLADRFSAQLLAQEPDLSPEQNLRRAGEMVRNWLVERGVKVSNTPPDPGSTKQDRKTAATARVASPTNARAQVGEDEPRPMRPSDVIAEMRRARGQPV